MIGPPLRVSDLEAFEQTVVPRYLSFFGGLAVNMLIPHAPAAVANVGCRWGFPDADIVERLGEGTLVGFDPSAEMIEVAKKQAMQPASTKMTRTYQVEAQIPSKIAGDQFTHAVCVHPLCTTEQRGGLLAELARLLVPGGQALLALPLRGSYAEIFDMVREYALRHDRTAVGEAVDAAVSSRPTIETITEELESAGLVDIDVDVQLLSVTFGTGREYLADPIASYVVEPEARAALGLEADIADAAMAYVREAVSKYWSDGVFELTVNVGCAAGRRPM
jgi:SAM-dependent methyltransferase